jgi:hypothetical protein
MSGEVWRPLEEFMGVSKAASSLARESARTHRALA